MNKYIIFSLLMFIAANTYNSVNAYTFPILNGTGKNLLVQVELSGTKNVYLVFAKSGNIAYFSWDFGNAMVSFPLNKIKCVYIDDKQYKQLQDDKILVDDTKYGTLVNNNQVDGDTVINKDKALAWTGADTANDRRITARFWWPKKGATYSSLKEGTQGFKLAIKKIENKDTLVAMACPYIIACQNQDPVLDPSGLEKEEKK